MSAGTAAPSPRLLERTNAARGGRHRVHSPIVTLTVRMTRAVADGWVMTRRALIGYWRAPQILVFTMFQPLVFVLLFAYVFGGAIPVPDGSYREFLMAGVLAQTLVFNAASTSVGMAEDVHRGLVDRLRSLPAARSAVLVGRTVGDLARNVLVTLLMVGCGLLIGWRMHDGVLSALAAFGLLLLLGFAFSWVGAFVGLSVSSGEAANSVNFLWIVPVGFLSNAFVPLPTLPSWLQPVAEWNPLSATVAGMRELFGNPNPTANESWPMQHPVLASVGWCVLVLAVFGPLAVRRYRRAAAC